MGVEGAQSKDVLLNSGVKSATLASAEQWEAGGVGLRKTGNLYLEMSAMIGAKFLQ